MSGLDTGRLNRKIRIDRRAAPSATGLNKPGETAWEPMATVWAEVQDVLPSRAERSAEGVDISARPARIRMRYRDDISSDMRIAIGALDQPDDPKPAGRRYLDIIAGPAELGDRDGTELVVQESKPS